MAGLLFASFWIDPLQTRRTRLHKSESEVIARRLQLAIPLGLTFLFAPLCHRHAYYIHARLAHQAHRQSADDTFVVRVWGEEERFRGSGSYPRSGGGLEVSQRQRFAFSE